MPRRPRAQIEGRLYHGDNWCARGDPVFCEAQVAIDFVDDESFVGVV